jgi:hypothetical protein
VWDFDVASDQLSAQPRQSFKLWEEKKNHCTSRQVPATLLRLSGDLR